MRTLLDAILSPGGLAVQFQPIYEIVNGERMLFALEALTRGPKGSNVERADVLFEYVRRKGREAEVDRACITAAFAAASRVPGAPPLSVNVHAATIERDPDFVFFVLDRCEQFGTDPSRLILEIVEQQRFWDEHQFFSAIDALRRVGARIALDDIGLGYSNHRMLIEVQPDLFKIDHYFVRDCSERMPARAAIESIVLLASRLGARVVAEGVETSDDFTAVRAHGIDLMQGYYLARPQWPWELHEGRQADEPQKNSACG